MTTRTQTRTMPTATRPNLAELAAAARRELDGRNRERAEVAARELARRNLIDFACYIDPTFRPAKHLRYIATQLERVQRREVTRLVLCIPPRHGKSKLCTELFPAWAFGLDADEQVMLCTHTADLARGFSRNVRNLINSDKYQALFPDTRLSDDNTTIGRWTLAGKTRPSFMAVGVGGAPTGHGARLLLVDDPIKSDTDANSTKAREKLHRWYKSTIRPRLEPNAAILVIMQRWHSDDLVGRLLRDQDSADQWEVIELPALAEDDDPLGREPGQALWPARYPRKELLGIKAVDSRSFSAKYQQDPKPAEGVRFKRDWLEPNVIEAERVPMGLRWVRYWDLAHSTKASGHLTATGAGAMDAAGNIYIRRGYADKLEWPDVKPLIKERCQVERETRHGIEAKVHGGPAVQELLRDRDLVGIAIQPVNVAADKLVRAAPVETRAKEGKLFFVIEGKHDRRWVRDWIDEMCEFPFGTYDDRVDVVSGIFQMLSGGANAQPFTAATSGTKRIGNGGNMMSGGVRGQLNEMNPGNGRGMLGMDGLPGELGRGSR